MTKSTFEELVAAHRRELLAHCYRLLGSLSDAEDVLQETLLAAWRGLDDFEHRASIRTWLYRIATNRCLNWMRNRSRRVPAEPIPPFTPPAPDAQDTIRWLQPFPDSLLEGIPDITLGPEARYSSRESIELAFVTALQRLTPPQAAALVLSDVLGYRRVEIADMLDLTPTSVKGLLQRARTALARQHKAVRPAPAPAGEQQLVRRFAEAFISDDIEGMLDLLTADAWLSMPPAPHQYQGRDSIGRFLRTSAAWRAGQQLRIRLDPLRANGQPAFSCHYFGQNGHLPGGIIVLTVAGGRISQITRFLDWELQRHPALIMALLFIADIGMKPSALLPSLSPNHSLEKPRCPTVTAARFACVMPLPPRSPWWRR